MVYGFIGGLLENWESSCSCLMSNLSLVSVLQGDFQRRNNTVRGMFTYLLSALQAKYASVSMVDFLSG